MVVPWTRDKEQLRSPSAAFAAECHAAAQLKGRDRLRAVALGRTAPTELGKVPSISKRPSQ